jgi:hypothetical protein
MQMKQRWFALCIAAVLLLSSAAAAQNTTAQTRVFDYAGLFYDEEAEMLETAIDAFQADTGYDFAILVTDFEHGYGNYQDLCDEFYLNQSLGLGMNRTALLCFLDLQSEGYYYYFVSYFGDLRFLMVDEDIQYLVDSAMDYFVKGDFTSGLLWTIYMLQEAVLNIGNMNSEIRVYDYAELLSAEEKETLEAAIAEFRAISGMDFLYLSTDIQMDGNENGEYLTEFYDVHGFGEGDSRSGAAFYLDYDLDTLYVDYYIRNFGDMDRHASSETLDSILEICMPLMDEGEILDAVLQTLDIYSAQFQ